MAPLYLLSVNWVTHPSDVTFPVTLYHRQCDKAHLLCNASQSIMPIAYIHLCVYKPFQEARQGASSVRSKRRCGRRSPHLTNPIERGQDDGLSTTRTGNLPARSGLLFCALRSHPVAHPLYAGRTVTQRDRALRRP